MKTKNEILILSNLITTIESAASNEEVKTINYEDLKPFNYIFLRNKLKFEKVIKEKDEILKLLSTEFKELNEDESKFGEFIDNSEKFKEFLNEEVDLEYFTLNAEKLENKDFNPIITQSLLGVLITE